MDAEGEYKRAEKESFLWVAEGAFEVLWVKDGAEGHAEGEEDEEGEIEDEDSNADCSETWVVCRQVGTVDGGWVHCTAKLMRCPGQCDCQPARTHGRSKPCLES